MTLINKKLFLFVFFIFFTSSFNLSANSTPESFADLVEDVVPGVVSIASKTIIKNNNEPNVPQFPEGSPFDEFFKDYFDRENPRSPSLRPMTGLGSGFIIDEEGIVVTNNHVIEGADEISIIMHDQTKFKAELLGRDPKADLAVLKFDPKDKKIVSLKWGDSDLARVGDWTIAIGNPLGLGGTVTAGILSAIARDLRNSGPYVKFLQTDASINQGNSGGPLFNVKGEVIGINTAIVSQTGGSIGLGFAIPSNSAKKIINQLKDFGRTKRGWLGVQITSVTEETAEQLNLENQEGAYVSNLNPKGPAKSAGLEVRDVILKFNGIKVKTMADLPRLVADSEIGSTAKVEVWRKNKIISIEVVLGELPEESYVTREENTKNESEFFVKSLNLLVGSSLSQKGVVVLNYEGDANLIKKDIITEVNREKITTVNSFHKIVEELQNTGRNSLLLRIVRDQQSLWVTINFIN